MAQGAWQAAVFGPTPISIHDDGNVAWPQGDRINGGRAQVGSIQR
jgi:hypothetical protein